MLAAACGSASAASVDQDAAPPTCNPFNVGGASALEGVKQARLGHVTPGAVIRPTFVPDQACTPAKVRAKLCASKVRPGTTGLLIQRYPSWACVLLPGKGKIATQAGWIPESRWSEDPSPPTGFWVGIWQNEYAKITVSSVQGHLHIVGNAIWQEPMGPHFGEFEVDATADGDLISLAAQPGLAITCELRLRRVGEYLFAQDNHECGGMNVTFDGLYRLRGDLAAQSTP